MRSCRDEPRLPPRHGRLSGPAPDHDRPLRADDGRGLLEARAARRPGDLHDVLPPRAVRWRLHARGGPRGRGRVHRALPVLAGRARAPRGPRRQRRPAAVRARLPRLPRGPAADGGPGRHARGHAGLPARAAPARHRSPPPGPAARERAAQPRQLPDAGRDQGRARRVRGGRRPGDGVRAAAGPGPRRRAHGVAIGLPRRLRRHLERARRPPVRHPGPRDARPLLDPVVRRRADRVRRLGRGHARQRRAPRRHVRHRGGHRQRHRHGPPDARAGPAPRRDPARLGRPRVPLGPGARDARRRRVRGHPGRRVERPRPGDDRVPAGAGRPDRQLGRRDQARDLLRPACARRGLQADGHPRRGRARRAAGGRRSRSAQTRPRSRSRASSPSGATTTATGRRART